ncbi:hypothetical protein Tco_0294966 [Tanacetum coccineum]
MSSPRASSTPSYSAGPSTPQSYSPGPSTPQSYSSRPSRNVECSNCIAFTLKDKRCVSDISELRLQEHLDMLVVTSGNARSWYMISGDAKSWGIALVKSFIEMGEPATGAGRPAAASRGGGTGRRAGRGGGRTGSRSGDQGNGRNDGQAQVGDQGKGQRNGRNQNDDAINDNIWGDVSRGCTYK